MQNGSQGRDLELTDSGKGTALLTPSEAENMALLYHHESSGPEDESLLPCSSSPLVVEDDDFAISDTFKFSWRKMWRFMGPGFLMSIAYIDPGNLESDLQAGAQTGYVLLWLVVFTTCLGLMVQMLSAKLGVVTGRHLAEHCRVEYPPVASKALWIMAEVAIIGSDIQEVIGCAIALAILSQGYLPLWAGVIITTVDSFLLLYIERWGVRWLEAFFATLIGVMAVTFGIMYAEAGVPFSDVAGGLFVPTLPGYAVPTAVALMGSLIMPHNIYLHSALVQTRGLSTQSVAHKKEALTYFLIESAMSLTAAVLINLFVMAVFANGFYDGTHQDIGLQNAGEYLGERYSVAVKYIWALGLLAAGQSSTMTGTYTGQFVMGGYLDLKVSPWLRVIITRGVAICPTLLVAVIYRNVDSSLDVVNQSLNLLQSVQLPFALIPVLTLTSSTRIMGEFSNTWYVAAATWTTAFGVMVINIIGVFDVLSEAVISRGWWAALLVAVLATVYFLFVAYLVIGAALFRRLVQAACSKLGWGGGEGTSDKSLFATCPSNNELSHQNGGASQYQVLSMNDEDSGGLGSSGLGGLGSGKASSGRGINGRSANGAADGAPAGPGRSAVAAGATGDGAATRLPDGALSDRGSDSGTPPAVQQQNGRYDN